MVRVQLMLGSLLLCIKCWMLSLLPQIERRVQSVVPVLAWRVLLLRQSCITLLHRCFACLPNADFFSCLYWQLEPFLCCTIAVWTPCTGQTLVQAQ